MNTESGPVRWGPNGPVVGGPFIVVKESGPVKWGHNGDGVVELTEFDDEKMSALLRQMRKDERFLEAHLEEWRELYPDMYVAVYQEELVGVSPDGRELVDLLEAKGIHPGNTYWQFLRSEPIDLMLPG